MTTDFKKRLAKFTVIPATSAVPKPGAPLGIDAPRVLSVDGVGVGLVTAMTGAHYIAGMESTRLLYAIGDVLSEFGNAALIKDGTPDLAAMKRALVELFEEGGAYNLLSAHMKSTEALMAEAEKDMLASAAAHAAANGKAVKH